MFGTNVLRKQEKSDGKSLYIQSIFNTIQGEGPFAGKPAIFVRLSGCNLRCMFCDTDFESRRESRDLRDIIKEINLQAVAGSRVWATKLVVITGGEPMIQNIRVLCSELALLHGYDVQIETAGTVWVEGLEELIKTGKVTLVCSPKTGNVHPNVEKFCSHWKYLIRFGEVSRLDGLPEWSTQIPDKQQKLFRPHTPMDTIWLQPCEEYKVELKAVRVFNDGTRALDNLTDQKVTSAVRDEAASQRNVRTAAELAMKYNYRISLQLHKLLGLP